MKRIITLGLSGVLLLTGCATPSALAAAPAAPDAVALSDKPEISDLGLTLVASATGQAPARAVRRYLRQNTLHGEVAIQTKKSGVRTVAVQRGSVTAVSADEISVKSSDGFALTWTFGDKLRIVQARKVVDESALKTGVEVGIAGVKDGATPAARVIVIT